MPEEERPRPFSQLERKAILVVFLDLEKAFELANPDVIIDVLTRCDDSCFLNFSGFVQ